MRDNIFQSIEEAGLFLKQKVQSDLNRQIEKQGSAVLILPGGNSIKLFFPYLILLDVSWDKITIGLSDERCVPLDDEMSNEKQLREYFLNHLPHFNYCGLNNILLSKIEKYPPTTILSMGEDGHVASLFPEEASEWCKMNIELYETTTKNPNRISLSEEALLLSSKIYILSFGKKRNIAFNDIGKCISCLNKIYKESNFIRKLK